MRRNGSCADSGSSRHHKLTPKSTLSRRSVPRSTPGRCGGSGLIPMLLTQCCAEPLSRMSSACMAELVIERSERQKVGMLLPPPIMFGLAAVGAGIVQYFLVGGFAFSGARSLIGGFVIVLSVILIGVSVWFFKKAGTPVRPVSPPTTIVRSGPYRFSRNPMYASMDGILVGLSICLGSLLFLVALVAALAIVHFGAVMPEERYLKALHGEAYRRYKMSVRRWV